MTTVARETFGHEPWWIVLPDFTKGYACARCRTRARHTWLDEIETPRSHVEVHAVPWPCATAVVLGIAAATEQTAGGA